MTFALPPARRKSCRGVLEGSQGACLEPGIVGITRLLLPQWATSMKIEKVLELPWSPGGIRTLAFASFKPRFQGGFWAKWREKCSGSITTNNRLLS
jgi:hypothetical protein